MSTGILNLATNLIGSIQMAMNLSKRKAWYLYTYNNRYTTPKTSARDAIMSITNSMLGDTFGPMVGTLITSSMPSDIDEKQSDGISKDFAFDFMGNNGQTYANNLMNFSHAALNRRNSYMSSQGRKAFNRQFYKGFYSLMYSDKDQVLQAVKNAENNKFTNIASWARNLFDPTQIDDIMLSTLAARLTMILRSRKKDPWGRNALGRASQVGDAVALMSYRSINALIDPNATLTFGGFKGASVAQLGAMLAEKTDFREDSSGKITKESIDSFKKKIQEYSKSLLNLRDIFGQDIPAMVTSILAITKQDFSQVSPLRIKRLGFLMQLTLRTTGLSVKDIVSTASSLLQAGKGRGLNDMQLIGLRGASMSLAYGMTSTYTPAGTTKEAMQGQRIQDLTSAQGSKSQSDMAAAYAVWKQNNKGDFKDFLQLVLKQVKGGASVNSALLQVSGANSLYLMRQEGMGSGYYTEGMSNSATHVSSYAQLRNTVRNTLGAIGDPSVNTKDVTDFIMNSDPSRSKAVMLAKTYDDLSAEDKKAIGGLNNFKAIKRMLVSNNGILKKRWASYTTLNLRVHSIEKARRINEVLNGEDGRSSGTIFDMYNRLKSDGSQLNVAKLTAEAAELFFKTATGDTDGKLFASVQNAITNKNIDPSIAKDISSMVMKAHASGLSGNKKFQENFKKGILRMLENNSSLNKLSMTALLMLGNKGDYDKAAAQVQKLHDTKRMPLFVDIVNARTKNGLSYLQSVIGALLDLELDLRISKWALKLDSLQEALKRYKNAPYKDKKQALTAWKNMSIQQRREVYYNHSKEVQLLKQGVAYDTIKRGLNETDTAYQKRMLNAYNTYNALLTLYRGEKRNNKDLTWLDFLNKASKGEYQASKFGVKNTGLTDSDFKTRMTNMINSVKELANLLHNTFLSDSYKKKRRALLPGGSIILSDLKLKSDITGVLSKVELALRGLLGFLQGASDKDKKPSTKLKK